MNLLTKMAVALGYRRWQTVDQDANWLRQRCALTGKERYATRMVRWMKPFSATKFYQEPDEHWNSPARCWCGSWHPLTTAGTVLKDSRTPPRPRR